LFAAEFQVVRSSTGTELYHVPHRFYHRYAKSTNQIDQELSLKRFHTLVEQNHSAEKAVLFASTSLGSPHSFGARRDGKEWLLMDSLLPTPRKVAALFCHTDIAGRASVMIAKDPLRKTVKLTQEN